MQNPFGDAEGKAKITRRIPNAPSTTVDDYIADAWAKATSVAPCIAAETFPPTPDPEDKAAQLVAILRGIILRWHEAQSGVTTTKVAGPYQQVVDNGPKRGFNLWPSEVVDLQRLCQKAGRPFSFDTMPDEFEVTPPLYGVVVNGDDNLMGPDGEWSDEEIETVELP